MVSSENGQHTTPADGSDNFIASVPEPLLGEGIRPAKETTSSSVNALTLGGRFLSVSIFAVARPSGTSPDCVYFVSGWGA